MRKKAPVSKTQASTAEQEATPQATTVQAAAANNSTRAVSSGRQAGRQPASGGNPSGVPATAPNAAASRSENPADGVKNVDLALLRLSQKAGLHATNCTAALIANRRDDIIRESASFLLALEQLWAHETVDPADIWTELLRRLEVAELLHQLNQPPHRKKRSGKVPRPWRITTSKLP